MILTGSRKIGIARIIKSRGNRGEVAAELMTDFPWRFKYLKEVLLEKENQASLRLTLDSSWIHKDRVVLKFNGIDAITPAEKIIGYEVKIPESELIALAPGSYYQHDLVGCLVVDGKGQEYGTVDEIQNIGGNYLLKVTRDTGVLLIPFAEEYFPEIDLKNRFLVCNLPEGLEDL